jgi:hypothetical protein
MHGASVVLLTVFAGRSGERQALLTARGGLFVPVGSVFVVALSLVNAISLHQFWPFLFAIWWGMALGLFAFVQLVFSAQANR